MDFGNKDVMGKLAARFTKEGGGGLGGARFMGGAMQKLGMKGSLGEFVALAEQSTGTQLLTPEERKAFGIGLQPVAKAKARGALRAKGLTATGLQAEAQGAIGALGPNLRTQALLTNKQLALGNSFIGTVQTLTTATMKITTKFNDLAGEPLSKLATTIADLTSKFIAFTDAIGGTGNIGISQQQVVNAIRSGL